MNEVETPDEVKLFNINYSKWLDEFTPEVERVCKKVDSILEED